MQKTMKLLAVAIMLLLFFFGNTTSTYSVPLKRKTYNTIRVSYMNGYIDALKLDIDEIKKLKQDKDLLRQEVKKAAARYLDLVENMNR